MKFKIDTKEKFRVITLEEPQLSAIMSDNLRKLLMNYLSDPIQNIILNLTLTNHISAEVAQVLVDVQQEFYNHNHSFVICCLQKEAEKELDQYEALELLNTTPTESEAWDIIQMEEIERELLGDENETE